MVLRNEGIFLYTGAGCRDESAFNGKIFTIFLKLFVNIFHFYIKISKKYWRLLNEDDDHQNIAQFLYIVEEYFLLGFIPIKDLENMLALVENKYTFAVNLDIVEFKVELKQACLNLVATLLLVVMNNQATEALGLFQVKIL